MNYCMHCGRSDRHRLDCYVQTLDSVMAGCAIGGPHQVVRREMLRGVEVYMMRSGMLGIEEGALKEMLKKPRVLEKFWRELDERAKAWRNDLASDELELEVLP